MDNKFFSGQSRFFHVSSEHVHHVPWIWFPAIWSETKNHGLSVSVKRITFAFARYRLHFMFGRHFQHPNSSLSLPKGFMAWASQWSGSTINQNEFDQWIRKSGWSEIVAWNGAELHYIKILLVREFLQSSRAEKVRLEQVVENAEEMHALDDLDVSLDITWDNVSIDAATLSTGRDTIDSN